MRKFTCKLGTGIGLALLSPAALAAQEEMLATLAKLSAYAFILFLTVVIISVYTMRLRDKGSTG